MVLVEAAAAPKLGTVEIRTLDAQSSLRDTEALVALTHCLARAAAEQDAPVDLPTELLDEGMFRATRFGVHARLPDARGGLHEFQEVLDAALELAAPHAAELGCAQGLAGIPALVAGGGGAGRQRAVYELSGVDSLLRDLIATTAETSRITQH